MTKETEKAAQELLKQLREHKFSHLDELWIQLLDDPPTEASFYKELAQRLAAKAKREEKLIELVALAAMQWIEQGRHRDALKVIQIVLPYTKNPKDLHEPLLACLRAVYADRANLERFLRVSGLLYDTDIKQSFLKTKACLACDEGRVLRHATRGVGVVRSIDEHEGCVEIDFHDGRPTRFSFDGVRQFLEPVPEGHFLARKALDPEGLKAWAREKPADFLKSLLKDFEGSIRQSEIKALLTTRFFTGREWTSWWEKNRIVLRLDPYIEFRGASNVTIVLRKAPRSFHEECAEAFEQAQMWSERHEALRQLAKVQTTEAMPEGVAKRLAVAYAKAVGEMDPQRAGERLEAVYLGQSLKEILGADADLASALDPKAVLAQIADCQAAIQEMAVFEFQCKALEHLTEVAADWDEIYASMYIDAPLRLAQTLLKGLRDRGKSAASAEAIESLFARPSMNPEVFVWTCRQILEEKWQESGLEVPALYLLICLLDFMEDLGAEIAADESAPASKRNAYSKIRDILMADGHESLCRVIRQASTEEARHFLAAIQSHKTLSDTYKLSIETALRNVRSDLGEEGAGRGAAAQHYVTAQALRGAEEEYQRLKTVQIPANSRAIGEAAALGDLRENADYHAAKERQKMLFARVEELHDLIARARPLDPAAIPTGAVAPGTRIAVRNLTRQAEERYTLLGIWDAVFEKGILYYHSPFASQFLGKRPGEAFQVELPTGERVDYQILAIENALADQPPGP